MNTTVCCTPSNRVRLGSPIRAVFRIITWFVVLAQITLSMPVFGETLASVSTVPQSSRNGASQAPQPPPANTATNEFVPAPALWKGAGEEEIANLHCFEYPLLPAGKTTDSDNHALEAALKDFSKTRGNDFSVLTNYLATHAESPWRPSLLMNLGIYYKDQGYFSRAFQAWNEAWNLASGAASGPAKLIADRSLAEYVELASAVGRQNDLAAMLAQCKNRQLDQSVYSKVEDARIALDMMQKKPALMFSCGPQALFRIHDAKGRCLLPAEIQDARSNTNGLSLTELDRLSQRMLMDYQMAFRPPGAEMIFPVIAHLKVGHYVAVVKENHGRYLSQDPAVGNGDMWVSAAAFDDEASGYCLVRSGPLPSGWRTVSEVEGQSIIGRGGAPTPDKTQLKKTSKKSGGCPPQRGMPFYSFHTMMASLNVEDTPLAYQPVYGPAISFTLTYNQRDGTQTIPWSCPNLGPQWTFDWLSYVQDAPSYFAPATTQCYLPGGGQDTFQYVNDLNGVFTPDPDSHAQLIMNGTWPNITSYQVICPDGSTNFYEYSDGGTTARKFYLTRQSDPQGNQITFTWSGGRLTQIKDAVSTRTTATTITYLSANSASQDYYKISQVADPFGRTATLAYGPANATTGDRQLVSITDEAGMTSYFNYRSTDGFMVGMTTPYGTTAFDGGSSSSQPERWLTATDPLNQTERLEYNEDTGNPYIPVSENAAVVPSSPYCPPFQNLNLYFRNSFFWSKSVMQAMGGVITQSSYTNADISHWLHTASGTSSGTLESFKRPLENRVWYRYPGQTQDAQGAWTEGTNTQPIYVARVLDPIISSQPGPTQLYQYNYNYYGKVIVATNPVGRITRFNYYPNQINLKEVRQDNPANQAPAPAGGDLLASYTYDTKYLRLVSTATDSSGNPTVFQYGAYGQLASVTSPNGKTATFTYDYPLHAGFLHTMAGTLSGTTTTLATFTPDADDRVGTVTDPQGYTISYIYDNLDRATNVAFPDTTTERVLYNNLDPVLTKDRQGNWTAFEYNPLRQLVAMEDSLGHVTQYNWCTCGGLESIVDPNQSITTWMRDIENRVTQKIYPDQSTVTYTYENTTSRVKQILDYQSQGEMCTYNVDDTVSEVDYPAYNPTPSVYFYYDPKYTRLTFMKDGTGTTTYGYYPFINPSTSQPQQGAGRVSSVNSSFTASTISYSYDQLGRVVTRTIDSSSMSFSYDDLERLTGVNNALGNFTYAYQGTTRLLSTIDGPRFRLLNMVTDLRTTFAYFAGSNAQDQERLQTIQNVIGGLNISRFDYQYDQMGWITSWTRQFLNSFDNWSTNFYGFQYDLVGQLVGAALTNGIPASPGTLVQQYVYSYDNAGNRTSFSLTNASAGTMTAETALFNNLNQMTRRTPGGRTNFVGTATAKVGGATTHSVSINGVPAATTGSSFQGYANVSSDSNIAAVVATDSYGNKTTNKYQMTINAYGTPTTLLYDNDGNLLSSTTGSAMTTYEWDGANRLTAINYLAGSAPGNRTEFTYDGLGRRVRIVEKNATGTVTSEKRYVWDGTEIAEERDASNNRLKQYFPQGVVIGANNYYYTRDHLGSIRELVDGSGAIRARYDYDPYGVRSANQITVNPVEADFGYIGYYYHTPSGLELSLYRAYNPTTGRWLNQDPMGEGGGLNLYDFARNNPINYVDPLGLAIGDSWDARTWFNSGFTSAWSDESSSIMNTWGDLVTGNWGNIANNYDSSSLGQSENIGGGVYTAEKGLLTTAATATTAATFGLSSPWTAMVLNAGLTLTKEGANPSQCPTAVGSLKRLHPDSTYKSDPEAARSLDYWRTRPTDEIIRSLKPSEGNPESLMQYSDGTMANGNTRTKVLEERGIDINSLPRYVRTVNSDTLETSMELFEP